jgi:hypothetical protein
MPGFARACASIAVACVIVAGNATGIDLDRGADMLLARETLSADGY